MVKAEQYKPKILIYGIDKIGYAIPKDEIKTSTYILYFEPFDTKEAFQDYDGVVLFQGIFEEVKKYPSAYAAGYTKILCHEDELQRRKKQYSLLAEKKGFICFILVEPFIDIDDRGSTKETDLAKHALNYGSFYRKNFSQQFTSCHAVRNEFDNFLKHFGAAYTEFSCYNSMINIMDICKCGGATTGLILWNREFFIPSLKPKAYELERYFNVLTEALIASHKKLSEEIPAWADEYRFDEEKELLKQKKQLQEQIDAINTKLMQFKEYKKVLCYDGELLRESVYKILSKGFDLRIDSTDNLREDLKVISENEKPVVLIEVKGTNKGVTRENVNQADSYRERANLDKDFPSVLIINTNISKSNSIEDKYQDVAKEQIEHAVKMNILVMRTIDLLNLLYMKEKNILSVERVIEIFTKEKGWLKVSQESWTIEKEKSKG